MNVRLAAIAVCVAASAFAANNKDEVSRNGVMIPTDQKAFLERVHHINQSEIELSKWAQTHAQSQAVKDFATQMVNDHSAADQQLVAAAKEHKIALGEPKPLNDTEKKMVAAAKVEKEKLQSLEGMAFDACYMGHMVVGHDLVIGKVVLAQTEFSGTFFAPMLKDLLPKLVTHRDHAYRVLGELKPETMSGTGGSGFQYAP